MPGRTLESSETVSVQDRATILQKAVRTVFTDRRMAPRTELDKIEFTTTSQGLLDLLNSTLHPRLSTADIEQLLEERQAAFELDVMKLVPKYERRLQKFLDYINVFMQDIELYNLDDLIPGINKQLLVMRTKLQDYPAEFLPIAELLEQKLAKDHEEAVSKRLARTRSGSLGEDIDFSHDWFSHIVYELIIKNDSPGTAVALVKMLTNDLLWRKYEPSIGEEVQRTKTNVLAKITAIRVKIFGR